MIITELDATSAAWKKVKEWAEKRLEKASRRLEGRLDHEQTTRLRGRIAELRAIVALDKETPAPIETDEFKD